MKTADGAPKSSATGFRKKLFVAMMLVVIGLTTVGLILAQRKVAIEARLDLLQDFSNGLAGVHNVQMVRRAALAKSCLDLAKRPRIHAALEDSALDLLYPSARDELRDLVERKGDEISTAPVDQMHAKFYRFLDHAGVVIPPPAPADVGALSPAEEAQLRLPRVSQDQQIGYLRRDAPVNGREIVDEVIAVPIMSGETGEPIAMLALGFTPVQMGETARPASIESGIWVDGRLTIPALSENEQESTGAAVSRAIASAEPSASLELKLGGTPHLVFYRRLNPGSLFLPAYEVALYSLADAMERRRQIRWQVLGAGALLLVCGLAASQVISNRLARPVESLAVVSEENRQRRRRAEAALESTSEELQRAARFSADASHQLKTPVSVLRAGIDELLAQEELDSAVYDKLSALLHQTYRITSVIDDLLLLSRLDAGRLQIDFSTVNLSEMLEEWIDDLSAIPDELQVELKTNFPPNLRIQGEKRYISLIVQNLLENARKYNEPGGSICVYAREEGDFVILCIENTGRPIPPAAQENIFERFHRGGRGENIPGHGLGLNLARELARFHGGDLRLVRSADGWTEFEVRFKVARTTSPVLASTT